ncbi:MAG TPA: helix-turn-helix domain-containing GNAT family N-acetyltransferase [Thermoanaerobaculia bacterium]|nr:helix-turn-helix domain-containing GNAT family N-acetyltransferase [Thermoanaerobaculia bacterium]
MIIATMLNEMISRVRGFNRFYTEQIGVLTEHLLRSEYSLTEVRVIYEIARRDSPAAAEIADDLTLDRGYLSRMLKRFEDQGVVERTTSPGDARVSLLSLTAKGRRIFRALDTKASEEVEALLHKTPPAEQQQLLAAMRTIEQILGPRRESKTPFILRDPHPGDLGWIVYRHGVLYAHEYRYDERFEALIAKVVAEYVEHFDAKQDRCWIAEKDGAIAGSVFLVRLKDEIAKLRLLYVEPSARGHGIGERLIAECVRFARQAGYEKVVLWTQSELHAARRLYTKAGFLCVKEEPHDSFGRDGLVAETWELQLSS